MSQKEHKNKCSCTRSCDCYCYIISTEELIELVDELGCFICTNSVEIYNDIVNSYPECISEQVQQARLLKLSLERELQSRFGNYISCNCVSDFQKIVEKAKNIVGICNFCEPTLKVDFSRRDEWIAFNPDKVSFKKWEKSLYSFCSLEGIDLKISKRSTIKNLFKCSKATSKNLVGLVSIQRSSDKLGKNINKKESECKIDFLRLKSRRPSCNLTEGLYVDLIRKSNMSSNVIECLLDLDIDIKKAGNNCFTFEYDGKEINTKDITFTKVIGGCLKDIEINKLIENYK